MNTHTRLRNIRTSYFGFMVGEKILDRDKNQGIVSDPGHEISDFALEEKLVPVKWGTDIYISWTRSENLTKSK